MAPSRGAVVAACVGGSLLAVALLGGGQDDGPPLDPRSDGPLGTSALVSLLEGLGAEVELSAGLPDEHDDVALLLSDRLDEEQTDDVHTWVAQGGTLVVTDPGSSFVPLQALPSDAEGQTALDRGICTVPALDGVDAVEAGAAVRYDTGQARSSCLGSRDFAYVVVSTQGTGTVVAVGGAAAVTNDQLADADNAVLAAGLLAPRAGTTVRFVDAPIPADAVRHEVVERLVAPCARTSRSRSPAPSWWLHRVGSSSAVERRARQPRCSAANCGATCARASGSLPTSPPTRWPRSSPSDQTSTLTKLAPPSAIMP